MAAASVSTTDSVAKIKLGKLDCLALGNLEAKRDWGFAKEYVEGMWRMLQADEPDTYVLATNRTETVRDFVRMAFKAAEIDVEFSGEHEQEFAVDSATGKTVMQVDRHFYRPAEVDLLIGDRREPRPTVFENAHDAACFENLDVTALVHRVMDKEVTGKHRYLDRKPEEEREENPPLQIRRNAECGTA